MGSSIHAMASSMITQQTVAPAVLAHRQASLPSAASHGACTRQRHGLVACPPRRTRRQSRPAAAAVPAAAAAAAAAAVILLPAAPAAAAAAALGQPVADLAAAVMDEAPAWTLDQAVGLVFGGLLLLLYLSSTQVDQYVARDQRRQLGLCESCGGLNDPATCTERNCPARRQ